MQLNETSFTHCPTIFGLSRRKVYVLSARVAVFLLLLDFVALVFSFTTASSASYDVCSFLTVCTFLTVLLIQVSNIRCVIDGETALRVDTAQRQLERAAS